VLRRRSLRARLIFGVIALVAIGLVAADAATYTSLRSFLVSRTDSSLDAAHVSAQSALRGPGGGGGGGGPHQPGHGGPPGPDDHGSPDIGRLTASVPGLFVQVRRSDGTIVATGAAPQFSGATQAPPPRLPATIDLSSRQGPDRVRYFTAPATEGGGSYRVRASTVPGADGEVLIVATSLSGVNGTLHRLVLVELLVTLAVLGGIALLGLWVIRVGLRPLTEIGATAATIAGGDLSRRVSVENRRTEVGRLGIALNAMLSQIETAFHARERSERKLRRFVADASHELRTPLAAVRAYAELFSRGASQRPADLARAMAGITRESERMSVLVEDLLLLARLDEGRPLAHEAVDLQEVVAESVETARTLEPGRSIECRVEEAYVLGDRDRLRQVTDNLLANVRAHADADASVDVTLERNSTSARLSVADSGPGLTSEQLEQVFERFYRADPSRARSGGGAGLGLAIVAAVTAAHGGNATAAPAPQGGASFTVEFPLAARP
jgi:two-component system OmpR family sensor kinase